MFPLESCKIMKIELLLSEHSVVNGVIYSSEGRWCNNIVLNVHAPIEDKIDDSKDIFTRNWSRF